MEKTICLFGDSITWGAWDPERGGWGARLRSYFETNNIEVNVFNCGVSGDNTEDLLQRFKVEASAREPNIIILSIGINDSQYVNSKDNPRIPIKKFQNNLQKLVNQAKYFTTRIIFIGLTKVDESKTMPIPWDTVKFYDMDNVSEYNFALKKFCQNNKLLFIDMLDLLDDTDLEDGLHPNSYGHQKIFERIKNFLLHDKLL